MQDRFNAIPTVDNTLIISKINRSIVSMEARIERASEFAALPGISNDPVLQETLNEHMLDLHWKIHAKETKVNDLWLDHGRLAPTQADWDRLTDADRFHIIADYYGHDCFAGTWELNPWGALIEQNSPRNPRH